MDPTPWTIKQWRAAEADAIAQAQSYGKAFVEAEDASQFAYSDQLQRRAHLWAEIAGKIIQALKPLPD